MSDYQKIEYYDLKLEIATGRLPACLGRTEEIVRISRTLNRSLANNACIVGPDGCGKTTALYGFAHMAAQDQNFSKLNIVMLNAGSMQKVGSLGPTAITHYQEAFLRIQNSIVIIDGFGDLVTSQQGSLQNWLIILQPLLAHKQIHLLISATPEQSQWLQKNALQFYSHFGLIPVEEPSIEQEIEILEQTIIKLTPQNEHVTVKGETLKMITELIRRFPTLGQLPKAGVQLLDEAIAEAKNCRASQINTTETHPVMRHLMVNGSHKAVINLTPELITQIVSEKTGIPLQSLGAEEKQSLKFLPDALNQQIVGQKESVAVIAGTVQRAKLGLRGQNRPLASFLLLGPSGVGKTETAKLLAQNLYGKTGSFLRIDMSEFGEAHTVQRLIGAPPGYTGFDSGGQLTNHLQEHPYSLILLDEIEKAHSKIFDIFLQLLDDGRLTSGQGQTVDATQAIFMATSNLCVNEIISHYEQGLDIHNPEFTKNNLIPILAGYFRMEFLNRFDAILTYNPLSINNLTDIALLEIKKIEQRVKEHNIKFSITRNILEQKVKTLADPRFGARPVKRFVEEMCENLIAEQLLK